MNRDSRVRRSVNVILEIIRKEFYQIRRDKRMLGVSMVAPILQVFLLGYAATTDIKNTTMVVCDMDKTAVSRDFIGRFTNSNYFIYRYTADTPDQIDGFIESGRAAAALVIDREFGDNVLAHRPAKVQMIMDGTDAQTANVLLGYANQIVGQYSAERQTELLTLMQPARPASVVPEPRVWYNPDLKSSNYMVPGVVAFVLMIITMTLTSLGIVREKELGTLEQLMVTPIKPYQLILGKLIPFVIVGFVDVIAVLSVARFWFEVPMHGSLVLLFSLSLLFILTTLGLGLFISTIAKTQQQAMLIAQFFFFMPFIFLSGFTFPIANMPGIIRFFTYFIPLRYFLEIIRGVFLQGSGLHELWMQAVAMLVIGVAVLTLSVMRFQKKLE